MSSGSLCSGKPSPRSVFDVFYSPKRRRLPLRTRSRSLQPGSRDCRRRPETKTKTVRIAQRCYLQTVPDPHRRAYNAEKSRRRSVQDVFCDTHPRNSLGQDESRPAGRGEQKKPRGAGAARIRPGDTVGADPLRERLGTTCSAFGDPAHSSPCRYRRGSPTLLRTRSNPSAQISYPLHSTARVQIAKPDIGTPSPAPGSPSTRECAGGRIGIPCGGKRWGFFRGSEGGWY